VASALWLFDHLRPVDRVNVLCFSSIVEPFAPAPVPATPENLAALAEFVRGFSASGSTALGDALREAAQVPEAEGRARTLVLLTDGRPTVGETDPARLVSLGKQAAERGLRVFPFGVGADLDAALLQGIAAAGGGRAEVFRPGGEVETRLTSFLARTASPVIADLELTVDGVAVLDVLPRPLPDAYLGEQVAITGRYRGAGVGRVEVSGTIGGRERRLSTTAFFPAERGGAPFVAQLFARQKLAFLEDARRLRLGLADDAYYAALDRGAYSTADEIVAEMIDVSLTHGVQCAFTSFLVLLPEDRARIDPRNLAALEEARRRARGLREEGLEEPEEELEELALIEEPLLKDAEIDDHDESDGWGVLGGDPDFDSDSPFDSEAFNDVLGIGGGAGGKFGNRRGGRRNLRAGKGIVEALRAEGSWLAAHQRPDGAWSADGDPDGSPDVGATALALLAFLGEGNTTMEGPHKDQVAAGVRWLRTRRDLVTGRIGDPSEPGGLHDHALATLALSEAYYATKSPLLKPGAQGAVALAVRVQGPDGGWCEESGTSSGDPTLTAWMVLALCAARDAQLDVDQSCFERALLFVGRASAEDGLTARAAAALLVSRIFLADVLGEDRADLALVDRLAAQLEAAPPAWDPDGAGCDLEAWCLGTWASFQVGGATWQAWEATLATPVIDSQRRDGDLRGSWDPVDPSPAAAGRVRATALLSLCLEVYFRYPNLIGAR
jgi:hypothetical protein